MRYTNLRFTYLLTYLLNSVKKVHLKRFTSKQETSYYK